MRESLFRAAQRGGAFPSEETVGQYQDTALTAACHQESFVPLHVEPTARREGDGLILWPYPKGTSDIIDRANCADAFARTAPGFRIVTELSLSEPGWESLAEVPGDLLVFAPFETVLPGLRVDASGDLMFRDRRCDVVMSEMIIGYLARRGVLQNLDGAAWPNLRTHLVNGSSTALLKGAQMHLFEQYCAPAPGLAPARYCVADNQLQLSAAMRSLEGDVRGLVVRPFSASQGTGVVFVDRTELAAGPECAADRVLRDVSAALRRKYGGDSLFPLTVSAFEESVLIQGCVTDLRIFVVFDPEGGGLRAVPGMVRRSQVPLAGRPVLDSASGMTNLNAPAAADGVPGPRIFPLSAAETLDALGLTPERLVELSCHATAMWSAAFQAKDPYFSEMTARQFCYGSVDFLIRSDDGNAVPIEMNGANVGSHPTVHPGVGDVFGAAATGALNNLGLIG